MTDRLGLCGDIEREESRALGLPRVNLRRKAREDLAALEWCRGAQLYKIVSRSAFSWVSVDI